MRICRVESHLRFQSMLEQEYTFFLCFSVGRTDQLESPVSIRTRLRTLFAHFPLSRRSSLLLPLHLPLPSLQHVSVSGRWSP
jgi:hypothetical protein